MGVADACLGTKTLHAIAKRAKARTSGSEDRHYLGASITERVSRLVEVGRERVHLHGVDSLRSLGPLMNGQQRC